MLDLFLMLDLQLFAEDETNTNNDDVHEDQKEDNSNNQEDVNIDNEPSENDDPFEISEETKRLVAMENNIDFENVDENKDTNNKEEEEKTSEPKEETKDKAEYVKDYKKLYEELLEKQKQQQQQQQLTNNINVNENIRNINNQAQYQEQQHNYLLDKIEMTPELSDAIEELTLKRAMAITGMDKDTVDALEYAEEDNADRKRFENAKNIAKNAVMNDLNNRLVQLDHQKQMQIKQQQENINDIQQLSKEITSIDNYQEICDYTTKEYIKTLPVSHQMAIRDAYLRAREDKSTVQDNIILRSFWKAGLNSYNNTHAANNSNNKINNIDTQKVNKKMEQKNKMPRVTQISGAGNSNNNTWTIDRINNLIDNGRFNEIPRNIVEQVMEGHLQ